MATEELKIIITADNKDAVDKLVQAINATQKFGDTLKNTSKPTADATMALSNLSRVAQDAPYGFMGIANNLNPLLESFQRLSKETGSSTSALKSMAAGLMGPAGIGLALGAVSSLIVAFGGDIVNFINGTDGAKKAQDEFNKSLEQAKEKAAEQATSLNLLIAVAQSANASDEQRAKALNAVKEAIGKVNQDYASQIRTVADATEAVNLYTQALIQQAIVQRYQDKIADKTIELTNLTKEVAKATIEYSEAQKRAASMTNGYVDASVVQAGVIGSAKGKLEDATIAYNNTSKAIKELNNDLKVTTEEAVKMPFFTDLLLGKTAVSTPAIKPTTARPATAATQTKEQVDTSLLETLKLKQKLYEDDVYSYKEYADKITTEELRVALERARISKASATEIESIKEQSGIKLELNAIQLGKSLDRIFAAADKEWLRQQKENNKKAEDEEEKATKIRLQQEADKQKQLEALQKQQEKFANFIASNVTGAFVSMYDAMKKGESPLQALGDYFTKLAEQIAAAAIQAAIFQTILMAFGGGGASFGEGFTGIFKGLLGMAEGGIVTRPTIAMVGEGGQSEAVMPLNKLGNMMNSTFAAGAMSGTSSGGNGQFVLKGQDLILAINRSNASLNLRRGF